MQRRRKMKKKTMFLTLVCTVAAMAALMATTALVFAEDDEAALNNEQVMSNEQVLSSEPVLEEDLDQVDEPVQGEDPVLKVESVDQLYQAIEEAREYAEQYHNTFIVLDPIPNGGDYVLSQEIYVPAKVTIDLNGQTVVYKSGNYAFYLQGDYSSITDSREKFCGTIVGSGIKVRGNNPNGSVTNTTILGAPEAGIMIRDGNVLGNIENCCIDGSSVNVSVDPNQYGIRIFKRGVCGDIKYNTISNTKYHAISLNGSAKASPCDGGVAGDIEGNVIENCRGDGISVYHGSHVGKITNNKVNNIGGHDTGINGDFAITVNAGSNYKTYAEEITDNVVNGTTFAGIVVFGREKENGGKHGIGYVSGDISGNVVVHSGTQAKKVNWAKSGKKPCVCEAAIYVDDNGVVYGDIHHNTVKDSYMDGISVISNAEAQNIHDNKIIRSKATYGVRGSGIAVKDGALVRGSIYNNTINNVGYQGFFVNSKSKVLGSFRNNKIYKAKSNGIFINQSGSVKTISKNTIKNSGTYGVFTGKKGKITTLSSNQIMHNNKKTMAVISNGGGSYIKKISGNTISGKFSVGILIKSSKIKNSILSNNMTSKVKSTFISLNGCKKKISIKKNKIKGNGQGTGIRLTKSKAAIKSNSIKKVSTKISR